MFNNMEAILGNKNSLKINIDRWWIFDKNNYKSNDPLKRGLGDNYGYFLSLGGLYLCFPGNWLISFVHLTTAVFHTVMFSCTACYKYHDLGLLCESLHFVIFLTLTMSSISNGLAHKHEIEFIMRSLGEGVYDYGNTLDEDSIKEIKNLSAEAKARKKLYTKTFAVIVMVAVIAISVVRPIALYFTSSFDLSKDFDGVNRMVPVPCWFPFDFRPPSVNILCFILQYLTIITVPYNIFGMDLVFLNISEEIVVELKTVGVTVRNITKRAKHLMKLNGDEDINKSISICLAHSIEHHKTTIRIFDNLKEYYFYLLVVLTTGSAFLLCLSGFMFTSNAVSTFSKTTFFFILTAELGHAFIFCWYGEQIKETASNIGDDVYNSDWINHSRQMKPYMLMLLNKRLKPLKLTAGGFMDASMNTFAHILSSAYSYFNLLNATN